MGLTGFAVFNNYRDLYNAVFSLIGLVTDISPSGFLKFDSLAVGRIHGSITPITTNLEIDPAYSVEGGMIEIIWAGDRNPNIIGVNAAEILSIGQTITQQGVYSIFMLFTGGKYKVNITPLPVVYVGDGNALQDPALNQRPVITLLGSTPVEVIQGDSYNDAGATASDSEDGDLTADIVTVNPVNVNVIGSYTVTYNVVDSETLAAIEVTRNVNVVSASVNVPDAPTNLNLVEGTTAISTPDAPISLVLTEGTI